MPVLPGVHFRDVWKSAGNPPDGAHAFLPAVAVRRRKNGGALDRQELSRVVRAVRVLRHPVQPRVPSARDRFRDPENR